MAYDGLRLGCNEIPIPYYYAKRYQRKTSGFFSLMLQMAGESYRVSNKEITES